MDNQEIEALKLHIAGATMQHISPFSQLNHYKNIVEITQDFRNEWAIPFYANIGRTDLEWLNLLISIKSQITTDIIEQNLGDFNWRTRQTGAFFAAITNHTQYIDIIGTHLLKSEVSYAGAVYCQTLASFNLPKCTDYITLYLDYYLKQPHLWFDQGAAMEAILYLDKVNGTHYFEQYIDDWYSFIENKPEWKREITTESLEKHLNLIEAVKKS